MIGRRRTGNWGQACRRHAWSANDEILACRAASNALWHIAAFVQFSLAQSTTLKILVPRDQQSNPIAPTVSASVAFLGGLNLPIGVLCAYHLLASPDWFADLPQWLSDDSDRGVGRCVAWSIALAQELAPSD